MVEDAEFKRELELACQILTSRSINNLYQVRLVNCDLSQTHLVKVNWQNYNLTGVRLRGANLIDANLTGAILKDGLSRTYGDK